MKRIMRCIPILLVCALLMATTSFATTKASEQIASYSILQPRWVTEKLVSIFPLRLLVL